MGNSAEKFKTAIATGSLNTARKRKRDIKHERKGKSEEVEFQFKWINT